MRWGREKQVEVRWRSGIERNREVLRLWFHDVDDAEQCLVVLVDRGKIGVSV